MEHERPRRERLLAAEADLLELARALDRPVADEDYLLTQIALAARRGRCYAA